MELKNYIILFTNYCLNIKYWFLGTVSTSNMFPHLIAIILIEVQFTLFKIILHNDHKSTGISEYCRVKTRCFEKRIRCNLRYYIRSS